MSGSILDQLNPQQREAVINWQGPLLILAGAGSGKTRVLTHRIAYLIANEGVAPWNVLAVTFTNKAANEMRLRVEKLLGTSARDMILGTFHSSCVRVLRRESSHIGFSRDFVIYDTDDQIRMLKSVLKDLQINEKIVSPRAAQSRISAAKNVLIAPTDYLSWVSDPNFMDEQIARIYEYYQKQLRSNSAMDFDDLIMHTITLLNDNANILDRYQERFKFIMVDEYQDTNHAQYVLINLLAQKYRNLCCVGDDDQSIYGWRGADISNILDFEKDYPEAKIIRLEQNYRSTGKILQAASAVVRHNTLRKGKELWTKNKPGAPVTVIESVNERREADEVVSIINDLKSRDANSNFQDFAVLYRTNAQSRALEESFRWNQIPYNIVGGVRFYDRKEVKDVIAYLRTVSNPTDSVSIKRIINIPKRGIGATTVDKLAELSTQQECSLFQAMEQVDLISSIARGARQEIKNFVEMIQRFQAKKDDLPLPDLAHQMLLECGYLNDLRTSTDPDKESRLENINELLAALKNHHEEAEEPTLENYLANVALVSDVDQWDDAKQAVTLMTLHSAKGLEFPYVFITGLEECLLPHVSAFDDPDQLEEERRLFYVGITRAESNLYLMYAKSRSRFGYEATVSVPSRFLKEVPREVIDMRVPASSPTSLDDAAVTTAKPILPKKAKSSPAAQAVISGEKISNRFKIGDRVSHASWGDGEVIHSEGQGERQKVTIRFGSLEKKLMVKFANLQKI